MHKLLTYNFKKDLSLISEFDWEDMDSLLAISLLIMSFTFAENHLIVERTQSDFAGRDHQEVMNKLSLDATTTKKKLPIMTISDIYEEEIAKLKSSIEHNSDSLTIILSTVTENSKNIEMNSNNMEDNSNKITNVSTTLAENLEDINANLTNNIQQVSISTTERTDEVSKQIDYNTDASKYKVQSLFRVTANGTRS